MPFFSAFLESEDFQGILRAGAGVSCSKRPSCAGRRRAASTFDRALDLPGGHQATDASNERYSTDLRAPNSLPEAHGPNKANAIFAQESEFILRAAPGSGKTWTSCRRFIWRGANRQHRVGGLALLSFTNTAIREFQAATVAVGRSELAFGAELRLEPLTLLWSVFIIAPFGHLEHALPHDDHDLFHSAAREASGITRPSTRGYDTKRWPESCRFPRGT